MCKGVTRKEKMDIFLAKAESGSDLECWPVRAEGIVISITNDEKRLIYFIPVLHRFLDK